MSGASLFSRNSPMMIKFFTHDSKKTSGFNKKLQLPEGTPRHNMLNDTGNVSSIIQSRVSSRDNIYFPGPQTFDNTFKDYFSFLFIVSMCLNVRP